MDSRGTTLMWAGGINVFCWAAEYFGHIVTEGKPPQIGSVRNTLKVYFPRCEFSWSGKLNIVDDLFGAIVCVLGDVLLDWV
jgi:hypothetical protein